VQGDPAALLAPAVALVGARAASEYGLRSARRLAADLARAGLVVVSGLARGIDGAAHEAALEAGGRTVAVLAGGLDHVYPPEHGALARRIAECGALASEFPLGTPPLAAYFPLRNRLISGVAEAVVVVEARVRSGSLVTARHALEQGRDVLVVPGPVDAPTSEGSNRLLRDGARPALDASDVLEEIAWARRARAPERPAGGRPDDSGPEPALLAELRRAPATRDELVARTGRAPHQLALDLLELELAGRVAEDRDGRLHAVGPIGPGR
jgi:DNA processing protein